MTTPKRKPATPSTAMALIDQALVQLACAQGHTDAAINLATQLSGGIAMPLEGSFEPPSNAIQTRDEILAAHRRAHRPGQPAKIDCNPDLQAFILARIETMTFDQIVAEIKAHFAEPERVKRSSVHRWWRKREKARAATTPHQL